jgi:hypothetical protein
VNSILLRTLGLLRRPASLVKTRLADALAPSVGADGVLVDARQATSAWLSERLRAAGVLEKGRVTRVDRHRFHSTASSLTRLTPHYSAGAGPGAPRTLFLKVFSPPAETGSALKTYVASAGQREAAFYSAMSLRSAEGDVDAVRCFDAKTSAHDGRAHLLLEDVSETHTTSPWPLPPNGAQCHQAIEALARLHAFWWEHRELSSLVGATQTLLHPLTFADETRAKFTEFAAFLDDRLPAGASDLYERALERYHERLVSRWERVAAGAAVTLMHGDAHWWNFLYPRDPACRTTYMIDWEHWRVGPPMEDVAALLALRLGVDRQELQRDLLRHYYQTLIARGVTGYSWDDCWRDYGEAVKNALFLPTWGWALGLAPRDWWSCLNDVVRNCLALEHEAELAWSKRALTPASSRAV